MLKPGQSAPPLDVVDHRGQRLRSEALLEQGPLIVYFYPMDFTPGCTAEACMFRDAFHDLVSLGATVIGISADGEESHRKFAERYQIPFSLVTDTKRSLAKAFGVTWPLGLGAQRVTFVIDRQGKIANAIHSELSMSKHVTAVRTTLDGMKTA